MNQEERSNIESLLVTEFDFLPEEAKEALEEFLDSDDADTQFEDPIELAEFVASTY